jgi:hypothetical protein
VWVVLLIVGVLAVALVRESWRLKAMETWCRAHGFTLHRPFVPGDHPPIPALAARLAGRDNMRWASGVIGPVGDAKVTVAEFEYTPTGRKTSLWFALAAWPVSGVAGPLVLTPRGSSAVSRAMRAVVGPSEAEVEALQITTEGSMVVHGEAAARQAWLTDGRRRALEAWPYGGQFVVMDGYAGWKTEGLLTPDRLDDLLAKLAEARRAIE